MIPNKLSNNVLSLSKIQNNHKNIHVNLIKIKSHTDIQGNNKIDSLVRNKTKTTFYKSSLFKYISYQYP